MPRRPSHLVRRVRDEADARALLAQVRASGLPLKTWCDTHDVSAHSLYWWRVKLGNAGGARGRGRVVAPEEVPVVEVSLQGVSEPVCYEVVLPNRVVVRVDGRFEAPVLQRLLSVAMRC